MVMNKLRETASGGIGKFILFGFLVLAVLGLALTDIGGFFRGGNSSNDVLKMGSHKITIQEFDRTVRQQLAPLGIQPSDAYITGFMDRILASEVQRLVLEDLVDQSGIEIPKQRVAQHIATLLAPMAADGQSPSDYLKQILANQRMSEAEFADSISYEMAVAFLQKSFQAAPGLLSQDLIDDLYRYSEETRSIEYLKFHDTEMEPEDPSDEVLKTYYDQVKEDYLIPEHRAVSVLMLDDEKLLNDDSLDTIALADKKYEMLDALQAKLDAGISFEELLAGSNDDLPLKLVSFQSMPASGLDLEGAGKELSLDNKKIIAKEAFALFDAGEISPVLELTGVKLAAVRLDGVTEAGYYDFDKIESQLHTRWMKEQQSQMTLDRTQAVFEALEESGQSLEDYADTNKRTYRTVKQLKRGKDAPPFSEDNVQAIFASSYNANDSLTLTLPIDGGMTLVRVTDVSFPQITDVTRNRKNYVALRGTARAMLAQARLDSMVEHLYQQNKVWVNRALLERVYAGNTQ